MRWQGKGKPWRYHVHPWLCMIKFHSWSPWYYKSETNVWSRRCERQGCSKVQSARWVRLDVFGRLKSGDD